MPNTDDWKVLLKAQDMMNGKNRIEQQFTFPDRLLPYLFQGKLTLLVQGHRVFCCMPAIDVERRAILIEGEWCE